MIATPIYDEVVARHPMPTTFIDTTFRWETFAQAVHRTQPTTPRPGVKPQPRKRTAKKATR